MAPMEREGRFEPTPLREPRGGFDPMAPMERERGFEPMAPKDLEAAAEPKGPIGLEGRVGPMGAIGPPRGPRAQQTRPGAQRRRGPGSDRLEKSWAGERR